MWQKGNPTVVVRSSLHADGKSPQFDSADAMGTGAGGVIVKGEGAQQVAAPSNIDVWNFAQKDHIGFGGGSAKVSLDHRVEAVFLLLTHLVQYVVGGNEAFGQASLRRRSQMFECFRVVAQGVRTFHA